MMQKFRLDTLALLDDGRLADDFDNAVERVEKDCRQRPESDGKRKITITLIFESKANASGGLERVETQASIQDNLPKRESEVYNMRLSERGLMWIEPEDREEQGDLFKQQPWVDSGEDDDEDDEDDDQELVTG